MTKTFRITVDGRSYTVAVEELASAPAAAVAAVAPAPAPATSAAAVAPPAAAAPIPAPPPALAAGGPGVVEAPIGGVVRSIDVEVGHAVAVGDKVAVIEAMKMKTEVRSKIAGKVTAIAAKVNEPVETGQSLMTLA